MKRQPSGFGALLFEKVSRGAESAVKGSDLNRNVLRLLLACRCRF